MANFYNEMFLKCFNFFPNYVHFLVETMYIKFQTNNSIFRGHANHGEI